MPEPTQRAAREWLAAGEHLPRPLRDFHDAKDVFKSLHEWIGKPVEYGYPDVLARELAQYGVPADLLDRVREAHRISWVDGQCYVTDYVLRFLAVCGWTLQRSRVRVEFASLRNLIKARRDREAEVLRLAFAAPAPEERDDA